jgi:hypothetical protein
MHGRAVQTCSWVGWCQQSAALRRSCWTVGATSFSKTCHNSITYDGSARSVRKSIIAHCGTADRKLLPQHLNAELFVCVCLKCTPRKGGLKMCLSS